MSQTLTDSQISRRVITSEDDEGSVPDLVLAVRELMHEADQAKTQLELTQDSELFDREDDVQGGIPLHSDLPADQHVDSLAKVDVSEAVMTVSGLTDMDAMPTQQFDGVRGVMGWNEVDQMGLTDTASDDVQFETQRPPTEPSPLLSPLHTHIPSQPASSRPHHHPRPSAASPLPTHSPISGLAPLTRSGENSDGPSTPPSRPKRKHQRKRHAHTATPREESDGQNSTNQETPLQAHSQAHTEGRTQPPTAHQAAAPARPKRGGRSFRVSSG